MLIDTCTIFDVSNYIVIKKMNIGVIFACDMAKFFCYLKECQLKIVDRYFEL